MHPLIEISRPLTSFMVGLAVVVSAVIGAGAATAEYGAQVILAFVSVLLFASAGNAVNDYVDRKTDKVNHPERPLPSGRIGAKTVLFFSGILFLVAGFLSFKINATCFTIAVAAMLVQLLYELKLKAMGFIGNVAIAFQTALAFMFGGAAVDSMEFIRIPALLAFLAILAREIIKDIEDMAGDVDRMTLPKAIGARNAALVASTFFAAAIVLSFLPYQREMLGIIYLPFAVFADLTFVYASAMQFKNPKRARVVAKYGMLAAMVGFLVGKLGV
ncbi:MAG: hypothetical protein MSIBF_05940 [Candidatus Altiarchaeales archaeon IMC4]|nr:MAG: hypothetical protein MSIBF_05940 [Candidatus Altiarchaeales archaeon IMC4]